MIWRPRLRMLRGAAPVNVPVRPQSFRLVFILITAALVVAALYTSVLIIEQQRSLRTASRYDVTWMMSQASQELSRLEAELAASAIPGASDGPETVQLWYDIVKHRVDLLGRGDTYTFIRTSPDLTAIYDDFRTRIADLRPMVAAIDQPGDVARALDLLRPLNPKLVHLAAAVHGYSGELVSGDLSDLGRLHWIFSGLLAGLIVSSFLLILLLSWHNALLSRAHDEVNNLVVDLRRTGVELTEANRRVHQAMDEVRLQNEVLQGRDAELNAQNARFDAALNNMSQALLMVDARQRLIVCNVRFLELFGLSAWLGQAGMPFADVSEAMVAIGRYPQSLITAIRARQQGLAISRSEGRFIQEIESEAAIAVCHQPMPDGGWVATYEDVTERRRAEARIRFMAHHDALTRLPNRTLFQEHVASALKDMHRGDERLSVLCLGLDYFKTINDTMGHQAGDSLLESVADRLRSCIRTGDVLARLVGDEFAILQGAAHQPLQAELLAQTIVQTLSDPYDVNGLRAIVGVSIGIAVASDRDITAERLLRNADLALYRAKAEGRGTHRFFAPEMDAQMNVRRTMEVALREALERHEFEIFYQPIIDLMANKLSGFEALLRWRHPAMGMISPAQFIPLAEELGLIVPIGAWVARQACRDAAGWPSPVKIAVNLSPVQFRSDMLVETMDGALRESGLAPNRLELEITESALLQNNDTVLRTLHRLRALGLRTSLDDFGTGYSSLSYLRSFPFDKLKIDQSFVREMVTRPDCRIIVNAITSLARQLGIITTAEGVETAEQLDQVRGAGCMEAQGYYFDRPQPISAIQRWFVQTPGALPVA